MFRCPSAQILFQMQACPLASSVPSKQRKGLHSRRLQVVLTALLFPVPALVAQTPALVTVPIDAGDRVELANTVRQELRNAADLGRADNNQQLTGILLSFAKTPAQEAALQELLADQQNPASPEYHRWLTPEQFGDRFGANPEDIAKVVQWLSGAGFSNIQVANGKNSVTFNGKVATVEAAFGAEIHNFDVNGEKHFANSRNIMIPAALAGLVKDVWGLHDFYPRPMHVQRQVRATPDYNSGSTTHYLAAEDIQTIYDIKKLYGAGYTGSGVKLVIVGEAAITAPDSNIARYRQLNGLPTINLQSIPDTGDGAPGTSETSEAYLDIEVAGAVAKGAQIIYVYTTNAFMAAGYAIEHNLGQILSMSFGGCEKTYAGIRYPNPTNGATTFEDLLMQANAQGMTVITSSGDLGAAGCESESSPIATQGLAVFYPASSVYVTAVGGATLQEGSGSYWGSQGSNGGSATGYIPEVTWNDTADGSGKCTLLGFGIDCASGGGESIYWKRPAWQVGKGISSVSSGVPTRLVPDLAFAASADHDGYLTCMPGDCTNGFLGQGHPSLPDVVGGTSAAAPLFAGIVALLDQKLSPLDPRQGNINPRIYALAASAPNVFHDVQIGTNFVPTLTLAGYVGYAAGPGYDMVTGWGSVDANLFVNAFASVPVISSWPAGPSTVPLGSSVTISYTATDSSGAQLSRAELWRAPDSGGKPGTWAQVGPPQSLSGSGPAPVTLIDTPTAMGKYWYGTHLFDGAGNEAIEANPTQVTVGNPVPAIKGFTPASLQAGSAAQKVTVGGTGFVSASAVTFNGKAHAATYGSATSISISLTASDIAKAGSYPVVVTNPAPGGGASPAVNFTVTPPNPVPTVAGFSPSPLVAGSAAQKLAIVGTGFVANSTVKYNGVAHAATYGSATLLTISLTTTDLAKAGSFPVVVTNPAPGGGASAPVSFVVLSSYPVPTISGFSPASLAPGSAAQMLTISGTGFFPASTVKFKGVVHTPTYVSTTSLTIPLTTADLAKAGSYAVVVTNPKPGGGASTIVSFAVSNTRVSNEWTWMSGSNTPDQPGVYGTQGVPNAANVPGSRMYPSTWVSGGNLWLFGGLGIDSTGKQGYLNDLWEFDATTLQWTWVSGSNLANQGGVYGTPGVPSNTAAPASRALPTVWPDAEGNLWLFGGRAENWNNGPINDLWKFSTKDRIWTWMGGSITPYLSGIYGARGAPAATNLPGSRYEAMGWVDANGLLWLYGGYGDDSSYVGNLSDLWSYNPTSLMWTWVGGSNLANQPAIYGSQGIPSANNTPGQRVRGFTSVDGDGNFWLFAGWTVNDLWEYTPATGFWTWVSGSNTATTSPSTYGTEGVPSVTNVPDFRDYLAVWFDKDGNLWLFGGWGNDSVGVYGALNDLWEFNTKQKTWVWMSGSNTVPGHDLGQPSVYGTLGVPSASNVPGGRAHAASWTDNNNNLWLFGGSPLVGSYELNGMYRESNELWRYQP